MGVPIISLRSWFQFFGINTRNGVDVSYGKHMIWYMIHISYDTCIIYHTYIYHIYHDTYVVVLVLIFLRYFHTVFHSSWTIYIPIKSIWVAISLYPHPHLTVFWIFDHSHPNRSEVISFCDFYLHLGTWLLILRIFSYTYWPFECLLWKKCLFKFLIHFLIKLLVIFY